MNWQIRMGFTWWALSKQTFWNNSREEKRSHSSRMYEMDRIRQRIAISGRSSKCFGFWCRWCRLTHYNIATHSIRSMFIPFRNVTVAPQWECSAEQTRPLYCSCVCVYILFFIFNFHDANETISMQFQGDLCYSISGYFRFFSVFHIF